MARLWQREPVAQQNRKASSWQLECEAIHRRKSQLRNRASWRRRITLAMLLSSGMYAGLSGWMLHRSGELAAMQHRLGLWVDQQMVSSGFTVRKIELVGLKSLSKDEVMDVARLDQAQPIFTLSLDGLRQRLESHPHIAEAQVERALPDRLRIAVTERLPAVLWQHDGQHYWLDAQGVMLDADWAKSLAPRQPLVVTGASAPMQIKSLLQIINMVPDWKPRVQAAQWVGNRRWNLWLNESVQVMLPMDEAAERWQQFTAIAAQIQLDQRAVDRIDLRLDDRAFVHYLPEQDQQPAMQDIPLVTASLEQTTER